MTKKRFKAELGYRSVHMIRDTVNHKSYEFVGVEYRNIETIVKLLNDVIK